MTIIQIEANENGSHENGTTHGVDPSAITIPDGWAIVPEGMAIPKAFPYVNIEVDETREPPVVTRMTPGTVPPPEPTPEPEPTAEERLAAVESAVLAMMMGG